jgi:Zn-dependent membrane protease YugP
MFFWDWTFLLVIPAVIFALWAQTRVGSVFNKYARVRASSGRTGADVARLMLAQYGAGDVRIESVPGKLSDHFDPRGNVLRLSEPVYSSNSVAALGVAAHEVGHALQHAQGYVPMQIRAALVGPANLGSTLALPLAFIGLLLGTGGRFLLDLGILLFTGAVLFHLVTLPVEFNASRRAYAHLQQTGILSRDEAGMARQVLSAAALTYVASAAVAVFTLLRLILLRNRN